MSEKTIKERLKTCLRKWPTAFSLLRRVYHAVRIQYLMELLFGTKVREKEWATRHLRESNTENWIKGYWDSQTHPHRQLLVEKIDAFSPICSILEIGCNSGPNLALLAKKFPNAEMVGIDINPLAVERGKQWLAKEGILNVRLNVGKADELQGCPDDGFDVVFTDAVLIYVGPDKIRKVVREMLRVARKALVLVEWNLIDARDNARSGLGVYHYGFWTRNYAALLKQFVREDQLRVTKIPEGVWPVDGWKEFGYVIEVIM